MGTGADFAVLAGGIDEATEVMAKFSFYSGHRSRRSQRYVLHALSRLTAEGINEYREAWDLCVPQSQGDTSPVL